MSAINNPTPSDAGGLIMTLNKSDPIVTVTADSTNWGVQTPPTGMGDEIKNKFNTMDLSGFEDALKKKLSGQNGFVFPGNGTFVMNNPMLNENGDLLVGISYE